MRKSRVWIKILAAGFMVIPAMSYAQLPEPPQRTASERVNAEAASMSASKLQELQHELSKSVVIVKAHLPKSHELYANGRVFDGAAVAIRSSYVREIAQGDPAFKQGDSGTGASGAQPHSFFDSEYARVSSPFAKRVTQANSDSESRFQYYLTTADWLTGSDSVDIMIKQSPISAQIVYRDDAQNLVVLSTPRSPEVVSVSIYEEGDSLPSLVFMLLSPNTAYESLTQHQLMVTESHLYGTANHTARNGYPMFSADGRLVGLSVGPTPIHTQAYIVHAMLIDRALHPAKYRRVTDEKLELIDYRKP